MNRIDHYQEYKPLLFSIAYHIVGRRSDAEDMVQEAYLALEKQPPGSVRDRKAYLCRTVHNLSINRLKSAARQRELYTGIWLPEPIVTEGGESQDPEAAYVMKESLALACHLLVKQLTATERIVFVLREVFQLSFDEIGEIVDKNANACRQVFFRARKGLGSQLTSQHRLTEPTPASMTAVVERFVSAMSTGNISRLVEVLSVDSTLYMDGGGQEKAALHPIVGSKIITRFFEAVEPEVPKPFRCTICEISGRPGIIMEAYGSIIAVFSFSFNASGISDLYLVRDPEKLHRFNILRTNWDK
ncbi:RNA polymerase sigma factor SigJ [Paenibacillus sp. 1P07SE]|uniref:RNA polymerase sigma factor SigJ n=1 Tax=Paenibacillus sp. 1P07SE TaxID=3132209 RepID=UPI0039A3FE9E